MKDFQISPVLWIISENQNTDPYKDAGVMHSVRSVEATVHWCQGSTSLEGSQV